MILRRKVDEAIVLEAFVARLLLHAELLEDGALVVAGLEVARVARELDPFVAFVLVRLDEGRPLNGTLHFAPRRRLKQSRGKRTLISTLQTHYLQGVSSVSIYFQTLCMINE